MGSGLPKMRYEGMVVRIGRDRSRDYKDDKINELAILVSLKNFLLRE